MAAQALAQQQVVFDRWAEDDRSLSPLRFAMNWATFVLLPTSVLAVFVQPAAAPWLAPLVAMAAWNWRRVLKREIKPTTTLPRGHE